MTAEDAAVRPAPTEAISPWNIANALTVLRLLMVPVFALLLLGRDGEDDLWRAGAFVVFVLAMVTDWFDGRLARERNLITSFGKLTDPIADKALIGTAFVAFSLLDELAWPVTVVVIVREVGITLLRLGVLRHGEIPASRGGKLKTVLQTVAIGLYVLPLSGPLATGRTAVMVVAVAITLVTGLDYLAQAWRLRRDSARTADKRARRSPASTR